MDNRQDQAESDYISPGEAARLLGVGVRQLSRWADDGKLTSIRPGRHRRYLRSDVEARRSKAVNAA